MIPRTTSVANDNGYRLQYEVGDDGPYPMGYYLHDLWVPCDRVPEPEKDELFRLAWNAWHQRGHGDYYEDDYR